MTRGRMLAIAALALLMVAAAPLLGTWVFLVAATLIILAVVVSGRDAVWSSIAVTLGLLGGLAGAASTLAALRHHASDSLYAGREWAGGAAFVLALAAAAGSLLSATHLRRAAALLVRGSLFGFIAINLYDINTLYFLTLPTCWLAATIALVIRPAVV